MQSVENNASAQNNSVQTTALWHVTDMFKQQLRQTRCQAKFLTSHYARMHRVIFYTPNTLIKLIIRV